MIERAAAPRRAPGVVVLAPSEPARHSSNDASVPNIVILQKGATEGCLVAVNCASTESPPAAPVYSRTVTHRY